MWILDHKMTKKTLVTDSDKVKMKLSAEEWSFISTEEWIEDNISQKLDYTGVSGITVECNNPQSVSKITELIFGWPREKSPLVCISVKIFQSIIKSGLKSHRIF